MNCNRNRQKPYLVCYFEKLHLNWFLGQSVNLILKTRKGKDD